MTGPSLGPLTRCPFAHCSADVMLVVEQATPGDDETTLKRVPQHRIVGEAERFGQCPASLMVIPLDRYSREMLATQARAFNPMMRQQVDPEPPRTPGPRGGPPGVLRPNPDPNHPWFRWNPGRGTPGVNVPQGGKAGQGVVPLPDVPHAGPGPGRASKPYQPTAADVVEQQVPPKLKLVPPPTQQGSTGDMSNDLRSQLIALTNLAIEGFGQEQEQCAALTGVLDEAFAGILKALEAKQLSTHQIALAAVGSRSDVPASAAEMIGASAAVGATLAEVRSTMKLLLGFVAASHAYAASAASNARTYRAII